ncbi:Dihydroorotate dehydrogenase (quinone) [Candidatus Providencia siddallii]|uniref:Dihydroorotate dehydrogenase (quinone) n=1 Tax=Candidatus Providencia siddallii TaxID=1715285 RepID=A0A0M6W7K5_9GAMM|nr:Dihydroorotate dehydrogenase (quinone) [Candidatus Providencia siddallii]
MLYHIFKKLMFHFDPEKVHELFFRNLNKLNNSFFSFLINQSVAIKPVQCMGLFFKNPLGLAAGLDKDGECIDAFGSMGFGFIEVGTVTPKPQFGNNKPRLFRIVKADALINRMGFNNKGVDNLVENIKKSSYNGIIGVNIGKNNDTLIEESKNDYLFCMNKVYNHAGYIVINISSPNTHRLRELQYDVFLDDLLIKIKSEQLKLRLQYKKNVPVLIKIAPDLTENEIVQFSDSLLRQNIDGVIATNTTLDHSLVQGLSYCNEDGGLSGRPVQCKSTKVIEIISREIRGKIPIIGVGGIDSLISAREKIEAGASLIQIYSGLIYRGPKLIKDIVNYI